MSVPVNQIPHDIDAEESVTGSLLIDGESIKNITCKLIPSDFYSERNMLVYEACLSLHHRSEPINQITVAQELSRSGKLTICGGAAYLSHLISACATSLDIDAYSKIVYTMATYRRIINYGQEIIDLAVKCDPDVTKTLDKISSGIDKLCLSDSVSQSRQLKFGDARLIQTDPPRYIWNVNGIEMRLNGKEITQWGVFKNRVIAELNFVPNKPEDWDSMVNKLLQLSEKVKAPLDASDEYQLKLSVQSWFQLKFETDSYSELSAGQHVTRSRNGMDYIFFQSSPLLKYLKDRKDKVVHPQDLWIYISKWGGIRDKVRVGESSTMLWGLPVVFANEAPEQPKLMPEDF